MVISFVTTVCSAEALVAAHEASAPFGMRSMGGPRTMVSPPWPLVAPAEPVGLPVLPAFPLGGFAPAPEAPVGAAELSGPAPDAGEHATYPLIPTATRNAPRVVTQRDTIPNSSR